MSKIKLGDVLIRVKESVDKDNTDLVYYIGGEHYESRSLTINNKGKIEGSTIGPAFSTKFKAGDVLLMSRNPHLRKAGIVNFDGICSDVSYIIRTKDENVVMQQFIPILFQSDLFWDFAEKNKKGSTNFFLNWSDFERFEFELPTLDKQQQLVNVLWAINDNVECYKEMLLQNDKLIRAEFDEMCENIKETISLADCCKIHARIGWQALTKKEHLTSGEFLLITGTDFLDGEINYSTCVYVSEDRYKMDEHIILKENDVLVTKDGTIGKVAIVRNLPKPATLNSGIFVIRPDDRFNKEFISYVFTGPVFAEFVDKVKTGATIKHLNQNKMLQFKIPLPTYKKQEDFAKFVCMIMEIKRSLQEGIIHLNNVYQRIVNQNLSLKEE